MYINLKIKFGSVQHVIMLEENSNIDDLINIICDKFKID
jgi:hypothetical protein